MNHVNAVNRLFCEPDDPTSEFDPYDWTWWDKIIEATVELEEFADVCDSPFSMALYCATFYEPGTRAFRSKLDAQKRQMREVRKAGELYNLNCQIRRSAEYQASLVVDPERFPRLADFIESLQGGY